MRKNRVQCFFCSLYESNPGSSAKSELKRTGFISVFFFFLQIAYGVVISGKCEFSILRCSGDGWTC